MIIIIRVVGPRQHALRGMPPPNLHRLESLDVCKGTLVAFNYPVLSSRFNFRIMIYLASSRENARNDVKFPANRSEDLSVPALVIIFRSIH